jgi:hypothetical protein
MSFSPFSLFILSLSLGLCPFIFLFSVYFQPFSVKGLIKKHTAGVRFSVHAMGFFLYTSMLNMAS